MKNFKKNICYYFLILLSVFIQTAFYAQQTDIIEMHSTIQAPEWLFYKYENTSLPDWPFHRVLVDNYDNIWAVTKGGELVKYDGAVWTVYNKENSPLQHNNVSSRAMDHYGNIWIGAGGGLAKVNGSNWEVYTNDNSEIPEGIITSIAFDNNNDIWLSTVFYLDDGQYSWFGCEESKLMKVEGLSVSDDPVWTFYDNTELAGYCTC